MTGTGSALDAVLAALLPSGGESQLISACLAESDAACQAWTLWAERSDPLRVFGSNLNGLKRWAPLLRESAQRHGLAMPAALATILRTAAFQEELRNDSYQRVVAETLARLHAARLPVLVLKGPALERAYPRPALRHSHDLELLLREAGDLEAAVELLGGTPSFAAPGSTPASVVVPHSSGLPIRISTELFRTPHYHIPTALLWSRRADVTLAGMPAAILSVEDTLLHILGHAASSPSRLSLQWIADAWFVLRRHSELDWSEFLATATSAQLRLVVATALGYLARELGAPIPQETLARLQSTGADAPRIERDALLGALRASGDNELRRMFARLNTRERLRLVVWLLTPSPAYLRRLYGRRADLLLPIYYIYRPFAYAARTRPWRLRSLSQ